MSDNTKRLQVAITQILSGESESEVRQGILEFCALGAGKNGGWGPRGTLSKTASSEFTGGDDQERAILNKWDSFEGEFRHRLAGGIGMWGGTISAHHFRTVVENTKDSATLTYAARALGTLGGPDAVTALTLVAVTAEDRVKDTAITELEELAIGGTIDLTQVSHLPATDRAAIIKSCDWMAVLTQLLARAESAEAIVKGFGSLRRVRFQVGNAPPPLVAESVGVRSEPWMNRALSTAYHPPIETSAIAGTVELWDSGCADVLLKMFRPQPSALAWCHEEWKYSTLQTYAGWLGMEQSQCIPSPGDLLSRVIKDKETVRGALMPLWNQLHFSGQHGSAREIVEEVEQSQKLSFF